MRRLDARLRQILHHDLPTALGLGDRLDPAFAEHRRAVIDRVGDVGDADGVLGADVAARPAVAAMPAGVLHHAGSVQPRRVRDRHRRQLHRSGPTLPPPCACRHTWRSAPGWAPARRRASSPRAQVPSSSSPSLTTASGQPALRNRLEIGPQHDAGVDQRPAAEAGCAEHGQPLADRQIVEPGRIAELRRAPGQPCRLAPCLGRDRKIAGPPDAVPARGPPRAGPCARGAMPRRRRRSQNRSRPRRRPASRRRLSLLKKP